MDSAHKKPIRSWEEIAYEASSERDAEKLNDLAHELEEALDQRDKRLLQNTTQAQ